MTASEPLAVLVVDDYPDTADTLAAVLRLSGLDARATTSAVDALARLDGWSPDVVLLDIRLGDGDGHDLARRVCDRVTPRPLVVAVSGGGRPADHEASRAAGFDHHLVKPVEPGRLLDLIGRHAGAARLTA